jgi:imidazolonepropionase-like amidohydrolase
MNERPTLHVRGIALPAAEPAEFWITDGRLSSDPVAGARTVADGGWLLPGLTDAHSHPGRGGLGAPLDEAKLQADARLHAEAGVALIRAAGSPDRPLPAALCRQPGLPRILDAGVPLGVTGQFPADAGRIVTAADFPAAAVENCRAASGGWCKLYADWIVDDATVANPPLTPPAALAEAVRRVHEIGGRVAVHATHPDACRAVVEAGADSLEHGMWLDPGLLPRMAAQGTALTPTITVWARQIDAIMAEPEGPPRRFFADGLERLPWLAAQAHAAGVTVLAGTDSEPPGRVAEEIRRLAAQLPAEVALGAGSWTAREFLGLPGGLADGAPADVVVYPADPRQDLGVLDHPAAVIIGGQLLGLR